MNCSFLDLVGVLLRLAFIGLCMLPVALVFGWYGVLYTLLAGVLVGVVQSKTKKPKG